MRIIQQVHTLLFSSKNHKNRQQLIDTGTKDLAASIGDRASKTTGAVVDGGKNAVNTTVETTGHVAHNVWDGTKNAVTTVADGTKNIASAGAEKTGQALEGSVCRFDINSSHLKIEREQSLYIDYSMRNQK